MAKFLFFKNQSGAGILYSLQFICNNLLISSKGAFSLRKSKIGFLKSEDGFCVSSLNR